MLSFSYGNFHLSTVKCRDFASTKNDKKIATVYMFLSEKRNCLPFPSPTSRKRGKHIEKRLLCYSYSFSFDLSDISLFLLAFNLL